MESSPDKQDSYPYQYIEVGHEIQKKVSAISALDNIISLGTEDGYLYSYEVKETADGYGNAFELEEISEGSKRGNDKIIRVQIIPAQYLITLLVDKNFYMVSMDSLSTVQEIKTKEIKNNVWMYAIRKKNDMYESIDPLNICLAIATNKNIHFWKINQEFKFEEMIETTTGEPKKFYYGDKIYALEWIENSIYIGTKNSYLIMNTRTGSTLDIKISAPTKEPQIGVINDTQVILLGKGNKVCSYNATSDQTNWFWEDMLGENFRIVSHNLNLVIMTDRELRVYNPDKMKLLQNFGRIVDQSARYTAIGCKKHEVVIAYNPNPTNRSKSKTLLKVLKEAPIDQQIVRLLKLGQDKEAERIFYIGNKGKPNIDELKKEFELNTGWIKFFERLDFESAGYHLINGKIDPRELMFYFGYHNDCKVLTECITKKPNISITDCIDNYMIENGKKIDVAVTVKSAKEQLLNILKNCYWEWSKENEDRITRFNASSYSTTYKLIKDDHKEIRVGDLLPLLKTVIIFILSDIEFNVELESFIKKDDKFFSDEVTIYLMRKKKKEPLAVFYEGIGDITSALKTWQDIGGDRAISKTVEIISNANLQKEELFKYWRWVVKEKPDQVIQIMLKYEKTSLSPEKVIDFLRDWDTDQPLVLKYLRSFIKKRDDSSQSLHNTLAFEYINQIYQIKSSSKGYKDKSDDDAALEANREQFRLFLNESKYYSASMVLNKIKNSWMMEEIILLLVKADQHSQALETYIDKNMDKEAEDFCLNMDSKLHLMTTLFEIYMKRFIEWDLRCETIKNQSIGSKEFASANEQRQRYENSAMNILKQHACHDSLNAMRIMMSFPDTWFVTKGRGYNLMKYLKTILDHKLTEQENNAIGEGLSQMEFRNMDHKLATKKQAFVKITSDYIWPFCKSRLDIDKLYVYPNGTVVHKHCGKKAQADKQDFNLPAL